MPDDDRTRTEPGEAPEIPSDHPPDWEAQPKDMLCPLCGYNLRGLSESRCPECGFKFTWQELIDAEKNRHPYLFEYGKGRNFVTLQKTYWQTCRPRRFWSDLHPAQPVRVVRLLIYWLLVSGVLGFGLIGGLIAQAGAELVRDANLNMRIRAGPPPFNPIGMGIRITYTPAQMTQYWPVPLESEFWQRELRNIAYRGMYPDSPPMSGYGGLLLGWPWLTLAALLVFRGSMQQARIRLVHLLRTVIYACDFGLLLVIAYFGVCLGNGLLAEGWYLVLGALLCCAITTYRLRIAFVQYLRVHLPMATVIASQVIAFLIFFSGSLFGGR